MFRPEIRRLARTICLLWLVAAPASAAPPPANAPNKHLEKLIASLGQPARRWEPDDLVPARPAFFEADSSVKEMLELRDRLNMFDDERQQHLIEIFRLPGEVEREYVLLALNRWETFHEKGGSTFTYDLELRYAPEKLGETVVLRQKIDPRLALRMAACWRKMCLRTRPPNDPNSSIPLSSEYHNFLGSPHCGGYMPVIGKQGKLFNMTQAAYAAYMWLRLEEIDGKRAAESKARFEAMIAQLEKRLKKVSP